MDSKAWGIEMVIGTSQADSITGDLRDNTLDGGGGNDVLRGGKGNDLLTGGDGNDIFRWWAKDVIGDDGKGNNGKGDHTIDAFLDHISDFTAGDTLNFSPLNDLAPGQQIADLVHADVVDGNTVISVLFADDQTFHDVVVLDGVTGVDLAALHAAGDLLI